MRYSKFLRIGIYFAATLVATNAFALGPDTNLLPQGGSILNEIERYLEQNKPLKVPPKIEEKAPEPIKPSGPTFKVKFFSFEGNSSITSEELQKSLSVYLNREISVDELKAAVNSLSLLYKDRGFLAEATLPDQDITSGEVKIIITEATFGGARLDLEPSKTYRVKPEIVKDIIEGSNQKGKPLNLDRLNKAILIAHELPGIDVSGSLQAGELAGQTESLIKLTDTPLFTGGLTADNYGSRATGQVRYLGSASFSSLLGRADRIDLTYLHSLGVDYGRVGMSMPLGNRGLKFGVNGSLLGYNIVANDVSNSKPYGRSNSIQAEVNYPIHLARLSRLGINGSLERKFFSNSNSDQAILPGLQSQYQVNTFSAGLSGGYTNTYFVGGQSNGSLDVDIGNVDYGDLLTYKTSQSNIRTGGNYNRTRWNLVHTQFIQNDLSVAFKTSGQWSNDNLDSSQKFYLGGASGVRAYPSNEGSGSRGLLASIEITKNLPYNLNVTGFYDYGHALQYINNKSISGDSIATGFNSVNLKGYGASVEWQGPYRTTFSAMWSRRLGDNPNPQATGTDSDGRRPGDFFWVKTNINF